MKNVNRFFFKPSTIALLSVLLFAAGLWMRGQAVQAQSTPQVINVGGVEITGVPNDWTHHHVVFSNPGTEEEATQNGRHEKWSKAVNDPRYVIQQLQRHAAAQGPAGPAVAQSERLRTLGTTKTTDTKDAGITAGPLLWQALRKPWRTLDRENPRALAIAGLQLAILILALAFAAASFRRRQWAPTLLLMLSTVVFVSLASCGGVGTSSSGGNSGGAASGQAIGDDWQQSLASTVTGQVQGNTYPAKYSFGTTTASCSSDFVVFPTGAAGASTTATIVAYNNIYVGAGACETTNPTVYWAYDTGSEIGTGYSVSTSPVLSIDGKKVAFIESNGANAYLVVLKWLANSSASVGNPVTISTASTNITTCIAPCMSVTKLSHNDSYSSPYYDYSSDALYVGDNSSNLYKATGVFNGTSSPTIATAALTSGNASAPYNVASPVYDSTSGCVFVGDSEGYVYSVSSGVAGTVCTGSTFALFGHSQELGAGGTGKVADGIFDAPLVDQNAGKVYVFITGSLAVSSCASENDCVAQFATSTITSGSTNAAPVAAKPLGTGGANYNLYAGNFDNVYYSSTGGSAGDLWVLGNMNDGGLNLYRIPIGSGSAMSTPVAAISGLTNSGGHGAWPSPITEFCNPGSNAACVSNGTSTTTGTDYLFFSVSYLTTATSICPTGSSADGCILAYSVNTPTSAPTLVGSQKFTAPGSPGCFVTGGIVVDNFAGTTPGSGTQAGASNIYALDVNGTTTGGQGTDNPSICGVSSGSGPLIAFQGSQNAPNQ